MSYFTLFFPLKRDEFQLPFFILVSDWLELAEVVKDLDHISRVMEIRSGAELCGRGIGFHLLVRSESWDTFLTGPEVTLIRAALDLRVSCDRVGGFSELQKQLSCVFTLTAAFNNFTMKTSGGFGYCCIWSSSVSLG